MFRRAVVRFLPKRGGGHDHPDFPFIGFYKHKRIISPTENMLWVYDGMNPEYLVDIMSPQYTPGHLLLKNFLYAWLFPVGFCFLLANLIYRNFKRPYFISVVKNDRNEVRKYLLRIKNEGTFKEFKHPLGHSHLYSDEGWVAETPLHLKSLYNV